MTTHAPPDHSLESPNSASIGAAPRQEEFLGVLRSLFAEEEQTVLDRLPEGFQVPCAENAGDLTYPPLVQVGVTNVCNLRCRECYFPQYVERPTYAVAYLDWAVLGRILDEVRSFPDSTCLRFLGKGESLMHPEFVDMLALSKRRLPRHRVACITNGILLRSAVAAAVLDTGVDVVDVSLDALTRDTYGRIRSNEELFPLLIENVLRLVQLRDAGQYRTRIMVSFLVQMNNYHEARAFKQFWGDRVDKVLFRKYHTYCGRVPDQPRPPAAREPCPALWTRLNITERGLITRCYVDWDDRHVLTDLNDPKCSILSTWSTAYDDVRRSHLAGHYDGICGQCQGWQTAHWLLSYERAIRMITEEPRD